MKKAFLFLVLAAASYAATSVTQYAITWTFDADYTVGQYANGDYYVVAPSGLNITAITGADSASAVVTGTGFARVKNGTMINPNGTTGSSQGFDSWAQQVDIPSSYYNPSYNKARPVRASGSDLTITGTATIVSSASHTFDASDVGNALLITSTGTGLTRGTYRIASVSGGNATLDRAAGTAGATGGSWSVDSEISGSSPLAVPAGSSVISSLSNSNKAIRPTLTDASILTVVASAPAANSFRPPYCGTDKTAYWTKASLDYTKLRTLSAVTGTPSIATSEGQFQRPWIDFISTSDGRDTHPSNNMPDYGGDMSIQVGLGMMQLMLNYSDATKETLLVRMVQYGIDVYGAVATGASWDNNGGHNCGRKPVLVLAAKVLNSSAIAAYCDKTAYNRFQEDQQCFVVDAAQQLVVPYTGDGRLRTSYATATSTVTISNASPAVVSWTGHGLDTMQWVEFTTTGTLPSPLTTGVKYYISSTGKTADAFSVSLAPGGTLINTNSAGSGTHTATFNPLGIPEWGEKHNTNKTRDGSNWGTYYRDVNYQAWAGTILAVKLLDNGGGQTLWNNDVVFDYMDRVRGINASESTFGAFTNNMWLAYGGISGALTVPNTPTGLAVSISGPARLLFTWTDASSDEDYFTLYRATTSGGSFSAIATIAANSTSYLLENAPTNRTYYYKLKSANIVGPSATYSNEVNASAPEPAAVIRAKGSAVAIRGQQ